MRTLILVVLLTRLVPTAVPADDAIAPATSSGSKPAAVAQVFEPIAQDAPAGNAGMFVGVCQFHNDPGLQSLIYATHDAIELAHLFVFELRLIPAENCHLLLAGDPASDAVSRHLEELKRAGAKIAKPDRSRILLTMRQVKTVATSAENMLVCSFSSHGFDDRADPYVMPSDGFRDLLAQTAVPLKTIETMIQDSTAGHRLLLVDACQERISAKSVEGEGVGSPVSQAFVEALQSPTGQAKFASCSPGEFSFEHGSLGGVGHGVFTYHVLEALRGGATADADNIVRLGDVADYVAMSVGEWSRANKRPRQTPFLESPVKTRQLPLATKADDIGQLIALLKKKPLPKQFEKSLRDSLLKKLETIDPSEPADRELLAFTRDYVGGRLSTRVFVPYVRSSLRGTATEDPDYLKGLDLLMGLSGRHNLIESYGHFRRAAKRGHVLAKSFAAGQHRNGTGVPKDINAAQAIIREVLPELRTLAEAGDSTAQVQYAKALKFGISEGEEATSAATWFRRSAEQGDPLGQYYYGLALEKGDGVPADHKAAAHWFRKSAGQNCAGAFHHLYLLYSKGLGVPQDDVAAIGWLRKAVDVGYVFGQRSMAYNYESGSLGLVKDRDRAKRYFKLAADQQDAHAMARYGRYLALGYGGDEDDEEALEWFQKSAFYGDWMGMAWLGIQYRDGEGVEPDGDTSVHWFRQAADQENCSSWVFTDLGVMFAKGELVPSDDAEAFRWFTKAAEAGDDEGQGWLGLMYETGRGTATDKAAAARWYRTGAEAGDDYAMFNLGRVYEYGIGERKSRAKAIYWYRKAVDDGSSSLRKSARAALKRLGASE